MADPIETSKGPEKKPETLGNFDAALEEIKQKVTVAKDVGEKIGDLYTNFNKISWEETFEKFKGIFATGFLGLLMSKEEYEKWKNEEGEDLKVKVNDTNKKVQNFEIDENISQKQRFVNMKSIRYFDLETGRPFEKFKGFAKILKQKEVQPSKFIMKNSSALFKEGVSSFSNFKKTAEDRLVDERVTDPRERERQAAIILSCCAIGRFQIVPYYHFSKLGLTTEGAEGLKNMYDFISSTPTQITLYEKITDSLWNKHKDPGLVAVEYYAGSKAAGGYKSNPNALKYHTTQYGKHGSIHSYAESARRLYSENKRNYPQAKEIDCLVMTLEKIESGGTVMRDRFLEREVA